MRFAYVGDFERTWTTESHVSDALSEILHSRQSSGSEATVNFTIQSDKWRWRDLLDLVEANALDTVFFSARPLRDDETEGTAGMAELRRRGVTTSSYHLDLFFGINRMMNVGHASWWKADFVFTADGGAPAYFWESRGVNHFWLPAAIPRGEIYHGTYDERFDARVAFVGSKAYLPEWKYRGELLDWLSKRYGSSFRIFPEDGKRIHGDDLNRLYASVDVVVGDTLCPNFAHDFYWSDRIYQTLGRGGVLVHPRIGGLDREYVPNVDFFQYAYGDYIALGRTIDDLLGDPSLRAVPRKYGPERTLRDHTYENRVSSMLERIIP